MSRAVRTYTDDSYLEHVCKKDGSERKQGIILEAVAIFTGSERVVAESTNRD